MSGDGSEAVQYIEATATEPPGIQMTTKYIEVSRSGISDIACDDDATSNIPDAITSADETSSSSVVVKEHSFDDQSVAIAEPMTVAPDARCLVCNDRASGLHYGVLACEGCKVGLLRVLFRADKYSW